jgi:hypothetical protein
MMIRIVKPFAGYRAGQVFNWGDGAARIYVSRGLAEPVADAVGSIETATVERRSEQAVAPAARRKVK